MNLRFDKGGRKEWPITANNQESITIFLLRTLQHHGWI
jgi:hypothetical protein